MKKVIFFIIVTCLLSACVPASKPSATTKNDDQIAQDFLNDGNFIAAAEEYQRLAEVNPTQANSYHLKAAQAFFQGDDTEHARSELDLSSPDKLSALELLDSKILGAKLAISVNDALIALNLLQSAVLPENTPNNVFQDYYSSLAMAQEMDQQFLNEFYSRVKLSQYLQDIDQVNKNKKQIWDTLTRLSPDVIQKELASNSVNPAINGWLELANISRNFLYNKPELTTAIEDWNTRYAGHPAQGLITDIILADAEKVTQTPQKIALLLPFRSEYREIAIAIREGFIAAMYESPGQQPSITIYNSDQTNIVDTYNQAIREGAEFIVGPLEKESIQALAGNINPEIPMLLLNRIDNDTKTNSNFSDTSGIYQFGLLPEDEAINIAEHAHMELQFNALVLTPQNSWGERIYAAFESRVKKLGGKVVEHVTIPATLEDYAQPVKEMLNITNSEQRSKALIATISRSIHFEPRHRQDADYIFIAISPQIARQIVPQLRFFRADDIPTYATSTIYTGIENPSLDSDLDGVIFADMPWILSSNFRYSPIQQSLNRSWNQQSSPYRRFYAFGVDAFRLITQLGKLQSDQSSYFGATGILSVNQSGQVIRNQDWARFIKGIPEIISQDKNLSLRE